MNLQGKRSEKQKFQLKIAEIFNSVNNSEKFFKKLESEGLQLYERGGSIAGIQGEKRRYRLKTLGYSPERIKEIGTQSKDRIDTLKTFREDRGKEIEPDI